MTIELDAHECAELVLCLKHFVDASFAYEKGFATQEALVSVIAKVCQELGMPDGTPWDQAVYDSLYDIAECR